MEYSTPQTALEQVDTTHLLFGNTLLLLSVLLFLAVLPRALRYILLQKESTALDRAVGRFEEEEFKAAHDGESEKKETLYEKPTSPKDRSVAYLMEDLPTPPKTLGDGGIPPFPAEEENEEKEKPVKIVKEGVSISHSKAKEPPPDPKKKVKLIKQEFSISPGENRVLSKKAPSEPLKGKKSKAPAKYQKTKVDEDSRKLPISENEESDDNWVEAEIPGLIIEPLPALEQSESIPTFKASPKARHQSEAKKSPKPSQKEKPGMKVKNIAPKSEEKRDSKPQKPVKIKADSPGLEIEVSESKPKSVEIKAPVVSHKNIAKKEAGKQKAKAPSSKVGKTQKTEAEVTAVPPQREGIKTSPEKAKPKPFLLDLKYLDQEELETVNPVSHKKLPADMVDVVIARLNALQVDLENQLVSIPGELMPRENPVNGKMRKDRIQDSRPVNESSDKKEVSLDELDSFLFTSTQRKNRK